MVVSLAPPIVTAAGACDGAECNAPAPTCQAAPSQVQGAAAMVATIDPKTGEYSAAAALPPQAMAAMTAPAAPPVVEALPGGGYRIDTSGYRHAFVATANPGGSPRVNCVDVQPAPQK